MSQARALRKTLGSIGLGVGLWFIIGGDYGTKKLHEKYGDKTTLPNEETEMIYKTISGAGSSDIAILKQETAKRRQEYLRTKENSEK